MKPTTDVKLFYFERPEEYEFLSELNEPFTTGISDLFLPSNNSILQSTPQNINLCYERNYDATSLPKRIFVCP